MRPEDLARGGIQAPDGVMTIGPARGEHPVGGHGYGGKADTDRRGPGLLRTSGGPVGAPVRFLGNPIPVGAAPRRPIGRANGHAAHHGQ